MKKTICCLILLSIVGCNTNDVRTQMINRGFSASYSDGYADGCASGYVAAGHPYYTFTKDTYRFETDSQYQQGWTDGFNVAKGSYESIQRGMR